MQDHTGPPPSIVHPIYYTSLVHVRINSLHSSQRELVAESRDRGREEVLSALRDDPFRRERQAFVLVLGIGAHQGAWADGVCVRLSNNRVKARLLDRLLDREPCVVRPACAWRKTRALAVMVAEKDAGVRTLLDKLERVHDVALVCNEDEAT